MQFKIFEKHTSAKKFQNCEQGKSYDYSWIISEAYNSDNMHEKMYVINILILFPCFCIMFPHVCPVFTEIYIAPSHAIRFNKQGKSYDYSWIISEAYNSDNMHEKMYVINILILFPCFCIMFPHVCTVFTEIYIAPSHAIRFNKFFSCILSLPK